MLGVHARSDNPNNPKANLRIIIAGDLKIIITSIPTDVSKHSATPTKDPEMALMTQRASIQRPLSCPAIPRSRILAPVHQRTSIIIAKVKTQSADLEIGMSAPEFKASSGGSELNIQRG